VRDLLNWLTFVGLGLVLGGAVLLSQAFVDPHRAGTVPGRAGKVPGRAGKVPGRAGTVPGRAGKVPGRAGTDPGRAGTDPGPARTMKPRPRVRSAEHPLIAPSVLLSDTVIIEVVRGDPDRAPGRGRTVRPR
jgi:hypothetical protein